MQNSSISNASFGRFAPQNVTLFGRIRLNSGEKKALQMLQEELNKGGAQYLTVGADIGRPQCLNHQVSIKLRTYPLHDDFAKLQEMRPEAKPIEYRGRSRWIPLSNAYALEELQSFLEKQIRYIKYCVSHKDHAIKPIIPLDHSKKLVHKYRYKA